jgi:hypothetical protein
MVEYIKQNNKILSIIIRTRFQKDGIEFFTPDSFSQQLAYMKRDLDYSIDPHVHKIVKRDIDITQEVLFIKSGKVRVDFYDNEKCYIESKILVKGDVILLADGGHGFKMLESSEIIEVKQGPYAGDMDKERFKPLKDEDVLIL